MSHLSINGHSRIVLEHFRDCFLSKDSMNGFPQLFQFCFHITHGHIPPQIAHVFGVVRLLTMTKPSSGVCCIGVGETLCWFTSYILCLQFYKAFATHFSPHQFGVTTKGGCEVVIHGIRCTLDLHPWLGCSLIGRDKCFQFSVKRGHISRTLCNKWGHHITHHFCSCILCIWISFVLQSS